MAEIDSDRTLKLEQVPSCRYRTPLNEAKQKMHNNPLHQETSPDDSAENKLIQRPNMTMRRYYFFFAKKNRTKKKRRRMPS